MLGVNEQFPEFVMNVVKPDGNEMTSITEEDLEGYEELERFHYRTNPSLIEQPDEDLGSDSGGRKAVILARIEIGKRQEYIGYMELTMPLMMVGPRTKAFSHPFNHHGRDVSWSNWSQNSLKQHLNLITQE